MKNLKNKLKNKLKNNKKGFTLVEIIVVLVILAVLAAAAIPTMLGFVDDAKGKSEIANARAAYVAAQSIATEEQASGVDSTLPTTATALKASGTKLDNMLFTDLDAATIKVQVADGKVQQLSYLNKGKTYGVLIVAGGETTVSKGDKQPEFKKVTP